MSNALITGGASGLGAEVARQLVRRGDRVVLLDVDDTRGRVVADELGAGYVHCDVADHGMVLAATARAETLLGGIDMFFLNAGVPTDCGLDEDFDLRKYRRANAVNIDGVVFGVHAALPVLRRRGGGSLVATASLAGLTSTPWDAAYGASEHAVVGLVRSLGPVYATQGIRINAFCPGFTETGMIDGIRSALSASGVPVIPLEAAGRAVLQALDSEQAGQAVVLQAGREPMQYRFRGVPGPLGQDGEAVRPAHPGGVPDPGPAAPRWSVAPAGPER